MRKPIHIVFLTLLFSLHTAAYAQEWRAGVLQSPKGVGVTVMLDARGLPETNIFCLRTDFYGFLSGRTTQIGAALSYTHDYLLFLAEGKEYTLNMHIGAGGTLGYAFDYEKGFFSSYERSLDHTPGGVIALNCDVGLRVDFRRRLTLDLSFNLEPGIHMRTDPSTGALLLSFYKNGVYRGYYPQLNLMYRF